MTTKHQGGCICGKVRYEVAVDTAKGTQCNCSICTKLGVTGAIVKPDAFKLLSDPDERGMWSRHPEMAQRWFCKTCGTHVYGTGDLPQLGGAFVSIYLNTLDNIELNDIELGHWDGRHDNWQAGMKPARWAIQA